MRLLIAAFITALLAACGADQPLRPLPAVTDPARASDVTVIRPRGFVAEESTFYITHGGSAISEIGPGQHISFRVPAGRQSIGTRCIGDSTTIIHDFAPGQVTLVVNPSGQCASIQAIDAGTARGLLAQTRVRPMPRATGAAPAAAAAPVPVTLPAPIPASIPTPLAAAVIGGATTSTSCPRFTFTLEQGTTLEVSSLRRERPELYRILERPALRDLFLAEWRPRLARLGLTNAEQLYASCGGIMDDAAGRLSLVLSRADAESLLTSLANPAMDAFLAQIVRTTREPRLAPEIAAKLSGL